jgi:type II secretion system protein G
MKATRAFTLIELLIVVAIIAILAAIAVPNFLEAQTRSKVSRVRADLRSLKLALEAYRTDNNGYPTGRDCADITKPGYPEGPSKYRLILVTTPIAYITSLPDDPFKTDLMPSSAPCDIPSFVYLLHKFHPLWHGGPALPTWTAWAQNTYPEWVLISKGPYREPTSFIRWIPYDPTNGTMSMGELISHGP